MDGETGFFYLNTNDEWPTFALEGLQIGADGALVLAPAGGGVVTRGVFRGGPFEALAGPTPWYRLQLFADALPDGAHIQLFTFAGEGIDAPYDPAASNPFADPSWQAAPRDVLDILILSAPATRLWIGGVVRSDGQTSPTLRQMRVDYGRDTYLSFLPAIYRRNETQRDFLERLLSLHASLLGGVERSIADLPLLFDAEAAPAGDFPSWRAWLAGWLAFDLDEAWSDAQTRGYLVEAFELYGKRGTVEGLRRYLEIYAGVQARIVEPILEATLWSLGESSLLGFTTVLAPGDVQGAVVGTSATLDRSHLTGGDDFGAALFEDLAHRFCVHIYCAELSRPGALEDVRAVIEQEKPAHTTYHLCVIAPQMRVGAQAHVGIDTIVGQGPPAAQLGAVLGLGTLAAAAEPCVTREER